MSRNQITISGDSAAIILPQELLNQLGLEVGDVVDVSVVDGKLVVQPVDRAERIKKIEDATSKVIENRNSVYEELAK